MIEYAYELIMGCIMNFWVSIVSFLGTTGDVPLAWGAFHLIFLAIFIPTVVLICIRLKNVSEETFRRVFLALWIILIIGEIYREFIMGAVVDGHSVEYSYQWYLFPFQICSAPLYALPLIVFLPDGKVRDAVCAYMMTFSFFGGIAVMILPTDVFCHIVGVNIQALVHHGSQVIIGLALAIKCRDRYNFKFFLGAIYSFVAVLAVAMTLNVAVHYALLFAGRNDTFNLFFISPFHDCHLPILSLVRDVTPYTVFLLVYMVGFSLVAAIMFYGQKLVIRLLQTFPQKIKKQKSIMN